LPKPKKPTIAEKTAVFAKAFSPHPLQDQFLAAAIALRTVDLTRRANGVAGRMTKAAAKSKAREEFSAALRALIFPPSEDLFHSIGSQNSNPSNNESTSLMSKSKSVSKYPEVLAFVASAAMLKKWPHLKANWLVPCPFCERVHKHGAMTPGANTTPLRSPHCPHPESALGFLFEGRARPEMYSLKFAGVLDDTEIFAAETRRAKRKYTAYLKGFEDRSQARVRESREAFRALSQGSATDHSRADNA
jgi:hypothetical protein